jgi:hypothetical protein
MQWLHPNHPPIDQIPPMPMGDYTTARHFDTPTDSVIVHDSTVNQTWELPLVHANGAAPTSGSGPGYNGADGFVVPPEMARNFGSLTPAGGLTSFPARANCRLLMRFVDHNNANWYYSCSGAMQDAGMVMCAAHCVYFRGCPKDSNGVCIGANIDNWAAEIWVYPAWDGNGNSQPNGTDVVQNWGWTHGTSFMAGSDYVNNGNFDRDFGMIMCNHFGERHIGMLTGWFGWAWGDDCSTNESRPYYNYSYPAESCSASLHTGRTMYFWSGVWDDCPGNQLQLYTTPGCFTTAWGGMSGSNAYRVDGGNRLAQAVASTGNRSTRAQYCNMWQQWQIDMDTQRNNVRGGAFDLEAFQFRLTGSTTVQATTATSGSQFVASNIANVGAPNATYTVREYLSTDDIITSSDTLVGTFTFNWTYAALQNLNVGMGSVTIPSVAPGNYWLGVIIDPGSDGFPSNNATSTWDAQAITVTAAPPPPPVNNNCGSATAYSIGMTAWSTTSNATTDGSATCGLSNSTPDVWYAITPPSCGTVHFDTCGSLYDTVLSLHTGCPGTTANQVVCNDDNGNGGNNACGGGPQSGFDVSVSAGVTYYLRVSGYSGASGNFVIHSYYLPPANDSCGSATPYTAGTTINGCMGGATNDGSAACGASGTSGDVWFTMTPTQTGTLRINTCGSAFDTVLSVHTGCPGSTGNQIACDDDSAVGPCVGTFQSAVDVGVVAGTTYLIRIAAFAGNINNGAYTLSSAFVPPANDNCASATSYAIGTVVTGVTTGGTVDGSSSCGSTGGAPDVWFQMTPSCPGPVRLSLCGSAYDTVMSVHSGCPGTAANQLYCDDDAGSSGDCPFTLQSSLDFNVASGTTYYIRISGFNGAAGQYRLSSRYLTAGSDDCSSAPTVGDGSYVVSNCGATTDGPMEHGCSFCCGDFQLSNDLWFRYIAQECGTLTVTTCGNPGFDTKLAAYAGGCPFGDDTAIACNDDAGCGPSGTLSRMSFAVTRGSTYTIRLGGYATARGATTMQISSTGQCGSADFNCDGDVGTDADIESFFACLAGNCPPAPCCATADFNGDGDVGTDADIEAFFRVLAGGTC